MVVGVGALVLSSVDLKMLRNPNGQISSTSIYKSTILYTSICTPPGTGSSPGSGLGVVSAAILLAGEMAGSGVLALPAAMLGTGQPPLYGHVYSVCAGGALGMALIITFTINSLYSGTRLGHCWLMLEERYEEYRGQVQ